MDIKEDIDLIEDLYGATIQHGPNNDRVYLMHLGGAEPEQLAAALQDFAASKGYAKIFAKIPQHKSTPFFVLGYRQEAKIPDYYESGDDALFLCSYLDHERHKEKDSQTLQKITRTAIRKGMEPPAPAPQRRGFIIRACTENDIKAMAALYADIFPSYPFPIHDPEYLMDTMDSHVDYFCIEQEGEPVALASAEKDMPHLSVEMTDFATLPDR